MAEQPELPPHNQGPNGEHVHHAGCFWCQVFAETPTDAVVVVVDADADQDSP